MVEAMKRLISGVLGAVRVDQRASRARGWVGGGVNGGKGCESGPRAPRSRGWVGGGVKGGTGCESGPKGTEVEGLGRGRSQGVQGL